MIGYVLFPINAMSKQNHAMRCGMRNTRGLKGRCYAASLIDLNDYLDVLPGVKISDKMCVAELNEILLNIIRNSWSNQAYVQGFYCEYITFKEDVNMFKCMKISGYIYEGVLETSYKTLLGQMKTVMVTAGKWEDNLPRQIFTPWLVRALES